VYAGDDCDRAGEAARKDCSSLNDLARFMQGHLVGGGQLASRGDINGD
jgi:hypothetical protein